MIRPICFLGLLFALAGPASAQALNVDFGRATAPPSATYGGAADKPGEWHQVADLGQSVLVVEPPHAKVSLTLVADNIDGNLTAPATDLGLLVGDNFFSAQASSWSVSISGLKKGSYDVYVYAAANSLVPTGDFTVNGIFVPSFGPATGSTMNLGIDYQVVHGVPVAAHGDSLSIQTVNISGYGGLSGMQLVPVASHGEHGK